MIEAEKMASKWFNEWISVRAEDPLINTIKELIQQVAERTLEECIGIIEETADENKDAYTHYENHQEAIRSCRWWEEEA